MSALVAGLAFHRKGSVRGYAVSKFVASSAMIAFAWSRGAVEHSVGSALLVALTASLVGDGLLAATRRWALPAGMGAFMVTHAALATTFVLAGSAFPAAAFAGITLAILGLSGLLVAHWRGLSLWSLVRTPMLVGLVVYCVALVTMTALAIGVWVAHDEPIVATAAMSFVVSDLGVAARRFLPSAPDTRPWALPLYYMAQGGFVVALT
ncbi:MAG: lysoplasmalogenase family protein [Myxococcota bacterium]|nr:lysoplasmalogenase family protein [Myxococcota bacterium]